MAGQRKFRVKKGQRVQYGTKDSRRDYEAGELVLLTDDEAKAMPWAVEPDEGDEGGGKKGK